MPIKNYFETFSGQWMYLENIMLSEIKQTCKFIYGITHLSKVKDKLRKIKIIEGDKRMDCLWIRKSSGDEGNGLRERG